MENCEKHSKKICAYCKHYDYCARVNRCDGRCYVCGINEFENNTSYKEQKLFGRPSISCTNNSSSMPSRSKLTNLQIAWSSSATTGTMKSISTRAMTGKITAKNCLKSANGGWTMTLSTTSTSRLTAERTVLPARRNTATESSKSQEDKDT